MSDSKVKLTATEAGAERLRDEESRATIEVSLVDVMNHKGYNEWLEGLTRETRSKVTFQKGNQLPKMIPAPPVDVLNKVLWDLGINTERGFRKETCKHRSFSGEVVTTMRYIGPLRKDKEFVDMVWREARVIIK